MNVDNFWNNNCTEYKSNGDENTILSVEEYVNKIRPYLRDLVNDFNNLIHGKFN